ALHWRLPFPPRDDSASKRAETDQYDFLVRVRLADELADIHLTLVGHVGETGIADVRVVFPDNRLCTGPMMSHQALERFGHVPVANIPCLGPAADHRAVIGLGIPQHERVLLGGEGCLRTVRS